MYHFCTYFDSGFLRKGLALFQSLKKHCSSFQLYVLCLDDETANVLKSLNYEGIVPIELTTLLDYDPALAETRKNRAIVEFYFTCTAAFVLFCLNQAEDIELITYLDADLYFYSSPDIIFGSIGDGSIAIVEHRYAPSMKSFEKNGIYNVSWNTFRKDSDGLECLHWWRERCIEWCYDRHEDDRYADQKYLDDWPTRFDNVTIIDNPGVNLAPWNVANSKITLKDNLIMVDQSPLVFFHFHGLRKLTDAIYDPNLHRYCAQKTQVIEDSVFLPYIKQLESYQNVPPLLSKPRNKGIKLFLRQIQSRVSIFWHKWHNHYILIKG